MIFRKQKNKTSLLASSSERQQFLDRLALLRLKLTELTAERDDLHRLVNQFEVQYHQRLGHHIGRILKMRRERASQLADSHPGYESRYQEAVNDYDSWHQASNLSDKKKLYSLSDKDLKLLKTTFRKAARKCHPDVTSSDDKEKSHQYFISLRQAYERNDLESVILLAEQIESEHIIQHDLRQAELDSLARAVSAIENNIEAIQSDINKITDSESYRVLSVYSDVNDYFDEREKELIFQYSELSQSNEAEQA